MSAEESPSSSRTASVATATPEDRERHRRLSEEIEDARWRYYVLDDPTLDDADFDRRMRELEALEETFPELRTPDSPTQKVGGAVSTEFTAVDHLQRMESLDNAFSMEEVEAWYARMARDGVEDPALLCELKVDGLAINLLAAGILAGTNVWGPDTGMYQAAPPHILEKVKALTAVCEAHNIPLGAAALQFGVAHPTVVSVLTGPKSPAELDGILKWWNTKIPGAFWDALADQGLVAKGTPLPNGRVA